MQQAIDSHESLTEYVDSHGETLRVDAEAGVLRGVKLLGLVSRNGRRYSDAALRRAMPLYEGAKVNVNHPKGDPLTPRDYQERIGVIRNVELRSGSGLYGVLHFNPRHALAEQLAWDAKHAPENVGLSHNVLAKTSQKAEGVVVDEITRVQSVDLVADPATTRGLFETQVAITDASKTPAVDQKSRQLEELTLEQLRGARPELVDLIEEPLREQIAVTRAELQALQKKEEFAARQQYVEKTLAEYGLPTRHGTHATGDRIVSEEFVKQLLATNDDEELARLVKDRAEAIAEAASLPPPRSPAVCREQSQLDGTRDIEITDAKSFVAAITR